MIVIQVSAEPKSEHIDRFEHVIREVVSDARGLPGCVRYEWFWNPDSRSRAFIYGEFTSDEAFAQYRAGPVVRKIVDQLIPLLVGRPSYTHFQATILQQG